MIVRLVSAILFTLLFCSPVQAGSNDGGRFAKLLSMLIPDSHMVVLMDLSKLEQVYHAGREWMLHTPAVESCPSAKAELQEQLKKLDDELVKIKEQYSVDITRDLHLLAVGIKFVEQGEPGLVMVLQGKFPEKMPVKIAELASAHTIEGHKVYLENDDHLMFTLMGDLLIMADPASMSMVLKNTDAASAVLELHPALKAGLSGGQIMMMDVDFANFAKKLANESDMRVMSTILGSLSKIRMKAGKGFTLFVDFDDAKGAQRGEYLLKGLGEMMLSGSHLFRAYGKLLLGFDMEKALVMPPAVKDALKNRDAVLQTLDEIFPLVKDKPLVFRKGNSVELSASRHLAQGSVFVLGIMSAVAIPAFIDYIRRSKQTATGLAVADVKTALDMFRIDFRRYPTTSEGLGILVEKGLLEEIPKDVYGNAFQYESKDKDTYVLRMLGADGMPGGTGENKDTLIHSD